MQVANALNNTIRILFNPKLEAFKLFDFLIVKSLEDRYLAQIIEIYDDKFDSSQNVAKLKLFYKIAPNNEVMPYDSFTPSKECEISKVNSDEVEQFINGDKETFIFATNAKNSQALNVQYDFFNNNPIIMSDKIENANAISLNLAKKLSTKRNAVIIDFTGIVEHDDAKKIQACKNFKLPLNYETIDFVFDRCLADASLEFQAVGLEIMNAIKKFAKRQEAGFIPFNAFVNVILDQYKVTPYSELQLLLVRMKKYQMNDIFAKNKKDYEALSKIVEKNKITIIDLSGLDRIWKKAYVEYIVDELKDNIYLLTRISEESFDTDLINKIYNEKRNIKFIPNVSYNYSKLPTVMQYCKNYVLMPSLNQRNDFLDANFALSNLISDSCIIFGDNTDNFLYLARDYELEVQEKRKNYRKIALSMVRNEENIPEPQEEVSDSQRLMEELSHLEEERSAQVSGQEMVQNEEAVEFENEEIQQREQLQDIEQQEVVEQEDTSFRQQDIVEQEVVEQEIPKEVETIKNLQEVKFSNELPAEIIDNQTNDDFAELSNAPQEQQEPIAEQYSEEMPVLEENNETFVLDEPIADEEQQVQAPEIERVEIAAEQKVDAQEETQNESDIDVSDEELDFFELADKSQIVEQEEKNKTVEVSLDNNVDNEKNNIINSSADEKGESDLNLSEAASVAIDNNFETVINSKTDIKKPTFEIDENTKIEVDLSDSNQGNLPIFKEEGIDTDESARHEFKVDDIVTHNKYGRGKIVKIIQHDKRQFLQIDFGESGKKLLDPKIAEIQLEQ